MYIISQFLHTHAQITAENSIKEMQTELEAQAQLYSCPSSRPSIPNNITHRFLPSSNDDFSQFIISSPANFLTYLSLGSYLRYSVYTQHKLLYRPHASKHVRMMMDYSK